MYWLLRSIGCSRFAAFFGSWMIIFDNLFTLYSRLILTDIYLWFFHVAAIAASFTSTRKEFSFSTQVRLSPPLFHHQTLSFLCTSLSHYSLLMRKIITIIIILIINIIIIILIIIMHIIITLSLSQSNKLKFNDNSLSLVDPNKDQTTNTKSTHRCCGVQ